MCVRFSLLLFLLAFVLCSYRVSDFSVGAFGLFIRLSFVVYSVTLIPCYVLYQVCVRRHVYDPLHALNQNVGAGCIRARNDVSRCA